jgi:hypothetical protein
MQVVSLQRESGKLIADEKEAGAILPISLMAT